MAEKISFGDLFDPSDKQTVEVFVKGIEAVREEYSLLLTDISKNSAIIKKNNEALSKSLLETEEALKKANSTNREGLEAIYKAEQAISVQTKAFKANKDQLAKLATENSVLTKRLTELEDVIRKTNQATENSGKSAKAAAGSIEELRQSVNAAKKAFESLGENADPITKSNALKTYTDLKQKLDQANKATQDAVKGNKLAEGSYNALQREVSELDKEYKNLPDALGKNKVQAEALRKTLFEKRQVLKDLDAQMNVYNRNVGNYAGSLKEAALNTNLFGGRIASAAQGLQNTQQTLSLVTGGVRGFGAALAATGIGAFLVAIGLVVNLFSKFDAFGDIAEQAFAGIGAAINVVSRYLAEFTVNIIDAFSNPKKALKDFADTLKNFVLDRVNLLIGGVKGLASAFNNLFSGNFKKAADEAGKAFVDLNKSLNPLVIVGEVVINGFRKMGAEMASAAMAAAELTARLQDLEDAERVFGVITEKNRGIVEQLVLTSKDQSLSAKERIDNLKKAGRIELEETQKQLKLAKERLSIIIDQNKLSTKLTKDQVANLTLIDGYIEELEGKQGKLALGQINGDDLDKQAEAQKALIKIQNDSLLKQQEIKNRESRLQEQLDQEELDKLKEQNKDVAKIEEEGYLERLKRFEEAAKKFDDKLRGLGLNSNVTEALGFNKSSEDSFKEYMDRMDARIKKHAETFEDAEKKKTQDQKAQEAIRQEAQYNAFDLTSEFVNGAYEVSRSYRDRDLQDLQNQRQIEIELAGDNAAQKDKINAEFNKKERKLKREQAIADREQALFNIAIQTAVAAIRTLAQTPLPAGAPLLYFTLALGAIQAATVLAKPLPKYATGTEHAQEGFAIVDEEGPELHISGEKAYMGSDKGPRLTYLKKGDKIKTAAETQRMLDNAFPLDVINSFQQGQKTLSSIQLGERIDYDKLASKLAPQFEKIAHSITNKPVANLSFKNGEFRASVRSGNNEIEYLKSKGINL